MTPSAVQIPTLRRLHRWLEMERWAGVLIVGGFWLPAGPLVGVLGVGAVVFAPVLIHCLWRLGRRGWLAAFAVVVGGAMIGARALPSEWGALAWGLVLLAFYAYTVALGLVARDWLRQAEEAVEWQREKARWAAEAEAHLMARA